MFRLQSPAEAEEGSRAATSRTSAAVAAIRASWIIPSVPPGATAPVTVTERTTRCGNGISIPSCAKITLTRRTKASVRLTRSA